LTCVLYCQANYSRYIKLHQFTIAIVANNNNIGIYPEI